MAKELLSLLDRYRSQSNPAGRAACRLLIAIEKLRLVDPVWRLKLAVRNRRRARVRIGFGPIIERENTLGFRKWAIDPIVNEINRGWPEINADIFFGDENLSRFDVLVIVKNIETLTPEAINFAGFSNTALIYNPRDNPAGCSSDYRDHEWFVDAMDGFILSSPAQEAGFVSRGQAFCTIGTPVINRRFRKTYRNRNRNAVQLVWQGYRTNASCMMVLHPIVERVSRELGRAVSLVYHCDRPPERSTDPGVRFQQWKVSDWERMLVTSDIGVVIKPPDDPAQQQKPPTKIISYMAAGLPVVCTPSEADRRVIEHGRTGFFAESEDEWYETLMELVNDWELRERIGRAAREHVLGEYGIDKIAGEYLDFVDRVREPAELSV